MADVVLHHYAASPFSELVRLAFGLKRLSWRSVEIPNVEPKPDLLALTGGYARTPVMQIGADIYCDTAVIIDAIEMRVTQPTLYPQSVGFAGRLVALWAGGPAFMPAVGAALGAMADDIPQEFWEDRGRRFGLKKESFLPMVPHLELQFAAVAALLEEVLADGRPFVSGQQCGHADLACYMNFWFQSARGRPADSFGDVIAKWMSRVSALGHGQRTDWTAQQAIDLAARHQPVNDLSVETASGFTQGQKVAVTTESPDPAEVVGTLVGLEGLRIVVEREDERAGTVHVHFPRLGQIIRAVE